MYVKIRAGDLKNLPPPKKKIAESTLVQTWRKIAHARKRNSYPMWIKFYRMGIPDVIHLYKFR